MSQDPLKEIERVKAEMDADILGPRPRLIPKDWPVTLEAALVSLNREVGAARRVVEYLKGRVGHSYRPNRPPCHCTGCYVLQILTEGENEVLEEGGQP